MYKLPLPLNAEVMKHGGVTDYRAVFDAEVTFLNGGGLQTQGFRLDLPARVRDFGTFPVRAYAVVPR